MKATVRCETPWATPASELKASSAPARESCQRAIAAKLSTVDLGRTGEVIGATVRAKYELDREKAEAATRLARALNDAELQEKLTGRSEAGWRYRKTDLWRDRAKPLRVAGFRPSRTRRRPRWGG